MRFLLGDSLGHFALPDFGRSAPGEDAIAPHIKICEESLRIVSWDKQGRFDSPANVAKRVHAVFRVTLVKVSQASSMTSQTLACHDIRHRWCQYISFLARIVVPRGQARQNPRLELAYRTDI